MTSPVLTASALGLTRNESGRRFPHAEDAATLEELRNEVTEVLTGGSWDRPWQVYEVDEMGVVEVDHLVERGLMTPAFADRTGEGADRPCPKGEVLSRGNRHVPTLRRRCRREQL